MRLVFWFFLLLNLAFFYWQYSQPQKAESQLIKSEVMPSGVGRLVLLRERGLGTAAPAQASTSQDVTRPMVTPPASVPPKPTADNLRQQARPVQALVEEEAASEAESSLPAVMVCFTLGPFKDESVAGRMYKALRALDVTAEQRLSERRIPKGYWVFLPPHKSYADASRKVKALQEKGLDDMYIMGKGEMKNAISLGLFTRKSTATARFNQVRRLDSGAMMKAQYRVIKEKWLDLAVDNRQTEKIASITALADEQPGVELAQRKACK